MIVGALAAGAVVAVVVVLLVLASIVGAWPFAGDDDDAADHADDTSTSITSVADDPATLHANTALEAGDQLVSADGLHSLMMLPSGRLVGRTGSFTWFTAPDDGDEVAGALAWMGDDGNVVIYRALVDGVPTDRVWDSGTSNHPGAALVIGDDDGQGYIAVVGPDGDEIKRYPQPTSGSPPATAGPEETTTPPSSTTGATTTSTSSPVLTVPALSGQTASAARDVVAANPYRYVVTLQTQPSSAVAAGLVLATRPAAGAALPAGSPIVLIVSSGS